MPTKKINPLEEHFEKGILGVAVLVMLYCLISYVFGGSLSVQIDGRTAGPGQAYKLVKDMSDQIEGKIREQAGEWEKVVQGYQKMVATSATKSGATGETLSGLPDNLRTDLVAVVVMNKESSTVTPPPGGDKDLPKAPAIVKVTAQAGRSTLDLQTYEFAQQTLELDDPKLENSWVSISGQIDLVKQRKAMEDLPEWAEKEPLFLRVDLQRAEVKPDNTSDNKTDNLKWEDVKLATLDPNNLLLPSNLVVESFDNLTNKTNTLVSRASEIEEYAVRSLFPPVMAGPDDWTNPDEEKKEIEPRARTPRPTPTPAARAQPVRRTGGGRAGGGMGSPGGGGGGRASRGGNRNLNLGGGGGPGGMAGPGMMGPGGPGMMPGGPGMMPGMMGPGMMGPGGPGMMPGGPGMMPGGDLGVRSTERRVARISSEERKKQKTLNVWVHDLTASPGKTYRYRMRVVMYNPLAGYTRYLKDRSKTLQLGIAGDWSKPSDPVRVKPADYFFVSGVADGSKSAIIAVYKWHDGWLCKENFTVKIGGTIGGKKTVKFYHEETDRIVELRKEVNFDTGAVLTDVTGTGVITVKLPDGTTVKQDPASVGNDEDFTVCKKHIMQQQQKLKINKDRIVKESDTAEP